MKIRTFIFCVAFMLLAACQTGYQEIVPELEDIKGQAEDEIIVPPEVTAMQEGATPTKSTLEVDENGTGTIYWSPVDEINVFYGTTGTHYVSQNTAAATTAVFRTTDIIGINEGASKVIWGLYPYNEDATCTGEAVTTVLPGEQYGVSDTFDDDLFITVARNTSAVLEFYNVCGGIKFSLSRDDITSITFQGNRGEDLAGELNVSFVDGLPCTTFTKGVKEITVTPKTGDTFASGVDYYIVIPPVTLSDGFTMKFETPTQTGVFTYTDKPVEIKRSIFGKKANIDSYATFATIPVTGVSLEEGLWLEPGQSFVLNPIIMPEDANNKTVTWESSDSSIASVSESGEVTGHHIGRTTITVTTNDGGFTASCDVAVWQGDNRAVSVIYDLGTLGQSGLPQSVTAPLSTIYDNTGIDIEDLNRVYESPLWTSLAPAGVTVTYDSTLGFNFQFENGVNLGRGSATCIFAPKYEYYQLCGRISFTIMWDVISHEFVDLGLPSGLKWATCNVGANSPEEYGDYFAWGETEPYYSSLDPLTWKEGKSNGYGPPSYQWLNSSTKLTKYNTYGSCGPVVDNKTTLEMIDDASRANWGGSWRMPVDAEWTELERECIWTWTTLNGVNGNLVTGPNGNSIFLPAAGFIVGNTFAATPGSTGYYWSSSLNTDNPTNAWNVNFNSGSVYWRNTNRFYGQSVRPVTE